MTTEEIYLFLADNEKIYPAGIYGIAVEDCIIEGALCGLTVDINMRLVLMFKIKVPDIGCQCVECITRRENRLPRLTNIEVPTLLVTLLEETNIFNDFLNKF